MIGRSKMNVRLHDMAASRMSFDVGVFKKDRDV